MASFALLIERLAQAVNCSGGENTAEYVILHMNADKLDLAYDEYRNCLTTAGSVVNPTSVSSEILRSIDGLMFFQVSLIA
jgi:hypothetical protein